MFYAKFSLIVDNKTCENDKIPTAFPAILLDNPTIP